jgi:hypothetical protein
MMRAPRGKAQFTTPGRGIGEAWILREIQLVAILWLMAVLSLGGWLIVNLDTAGWVLVLLTAGLMTFELTRRPVRRAGPPAEVRDQPRASG